jgi:hypothetical protein
MYRTYGRLLIVGLTSLTLVLTVAYFSGQISETSLSPESHTEAINLQPVLANWYMADYPVASSTGFPLAVHLVEMSEKQTSVIYSAPLARVKEFANGFSLEDDIGNEYKIINSSLLTELGQLEFGVMSFEPRQLRARQLYLSLGESEKIPLAQVVGPEGTSPPTSVTYTLYRDGYFEQLGYRISFNAWGFYKGDRVAEMLSQTGFTTDELLNGKGSEEPNVQQTLQPTATPITPGLTDSSLPNTLSNDDIRTDATLRVESISTSQVDYLYVVFLRNGDIKAFLLK